MTRLYLICASAGIATVVGTSAASVLQQLFQNVLTQLVHIPT